MSELDEALGMAINHAAEYLVEDDCLAIGINNGGWQVALVRSPPKEVFHPDSDNLVEDILECVRESMRVK